MITFKITQNKKDNLILLLNEYVSFVDEMIVNNKRTESEKQISHLENKYEISMNPWVKTKLEEMIATQYEQLMMFSESAIEILVRPFEPRYPKTANKILVMQIGIMSGFVIGCLVVLFRNWLGNISEKSK